jgi:glycosyltransferase involved in cell wall biosynthesis
VGELGLDAHVEFVEDLSTEGLAGEYRRAQLLVSPSLYEGFGLPAAEAMACGTPVGATTAGALGEIVAHGETGLLVPPGEVASLREAVRDLLGDPARCRTMGEAGARRARALFSWRRTAEQMVEVYAAARDARRARARTLEAVG